MDLFTGLATPSRTQVRAKGIPKLCSVKLLSSSSSLQTLHHELLLGGAFKLLCSRLLLALQALALFVLRVGLGSSCRCNISSHDSEGSQHASAKD